MESNEVNSINNNNSGAAGTQISESKVVDNELNAKHNTEIWNSVNSIAPLDDQFIQSLQQIEQYNKNLIIDNKLISNDTKTSKSLIKTSTSSSKTTSVNQFIKLHEQLGVDCVENDFEENEIVLRRYCLHMQTYADRYFKLSEQITRTVNELTLLLNRYVRVSESTHVLDVHSRQLVSIQQQLKQINTILTKELNYYLTSRLVLQRINFNNNNNAGQQQHQHQHGSFSSINNLVGTQQFYQILDQIDDGIQYTSSHPLHKQSELYCNQYKYSLSVVITLIKTYITNVLEQATNEAITSSTNTNTSTSTSTEQQQQQLKLSTTTDTELDPAISYYYGKFQAVSYKIQPIIQQIEARCHKNKEYEHLLNEIQQIYVDKRYELMNDSIGNSIKTLASKNQSDRSLLFRTACSLFMLLCQDEHQLYYVFFSTGATPNNTSASTAKLQQYLASICEHLYDTLRPCIVHIEHIEILCELCSILKYDVLFNIEHNNIDKDREALQAFNTVVQELLRDIQERLVFRSHIYFRCDILQYQPSAGDLAYPEKLQMMMNIVSQQNESLQSEYKHRDRDRQQNTNTSSTLRRTESSQSVVSSVNQSASVSVSAVSSHQPKPITITDLQGMWYPTIRRCLQCLSRLYRCVDVQTFQGLSQEAISFCVISINNAGTLITQRKSPLDGDLFQIKHLLILREQIAAFQVDFTARETTLDFTKVKEAAADLMHRKNLFKMDSNNAILKFLLEGTPQVKEHLLDSKKDADLQLKKTCQHLIMHVTNLLIDPLQQLNQKIQDYRKVCGQEFNLQKFRAEKWTEPENLASIVNNVKRIIKTRITPIQNSMTLYIHNRETESILFRPIKNNIIGAFVQLEQLLSECLYEWNELLTISCPTADQVSLMLSSVTLLNSQQQQQQQQQHSINIVDNSTNTTNVNNK
ncbi:conserved oligomeric Golgi complex subunit 3 [Chrysoperla carnea]|uniref:conserved oligomeric Golgi complex subunit 3 n=1 Tax=Chrysoperla carnea TaxID=189513 RepID=UPI001D0767A2|nr:conserved oligomeric Golgi complex subunit 3 [Chrysoperla carnea]